MSEGQSGVPGSWDFHCQPRWARVGSRAPSHTRTRGFLEKEWCDRLGSQCLET